MNEKHPTDLLPAFALDCLDPEEKEQVEKHLENCADCRAELQELEAVEGQLAYAVPASEPPVYLKARLLEGCRPQQGFSWFNSLLARWPRMVPVSALAACMLAIVFATTSLMFWHQRAPSETGLFAGLSLIPLVGTESMPTAAGQLVVDRKSGEGRLLVRAMQPLGDSAQYQLWLIRDGQRASGGVFSVSEAGAATLLVSSRQPFSTYDSIGITIEPFGGSQSPTGEKVLGGRMVL